MNAPDARLEKTDSTRPRQAARPASLAGRLAENAARNFDQWFRALTRPPLASCAPPSAFAMAAIVATLVVVVASMFLVDATASEWARHEPNWFRDMFEKITDFGLSGWFLFPLGFLLLVQAVLISPQSKCLTQGVLVTLAARFGFLFLAIGVPGLFVTIVKRAIGRARPYVGGHDDPFSYAPFVWRPEYASMPSGHATTAVAAAIAIGAIWPRTRILMWLYAATIMISRVAVLAHHVSDVIAGALIAVIGAYLVRRWFAARRLVFSPKDLQASTAPSLPRITGALREAIASAGLKY